MALKIIFMGTPEFSVPILKSINESDHKVLEVYTQPPKKSGRGQKINHSNIYNYATQLNLNVRCPTSLGTIEEINYIKKLNPDIVVVVAYGKIIPTEMLNIDNILFKILNFIFNCYHLSFNRLIYSFKPIIFIY